MRGRSSRTIVVILTSFWLGSLFALTADSVIVATAFGQETVEIEKEESGPSLEDLREMREQFGGGSGESIEPSAPSAGTGPGSLREQLRETLPKFDPLEQQQVESQHADQPTAEPIDPLPSTQEPPLFIQVQGPGEFVFGGTAPPSCSGGRAGKNQAVICVSGSTFNTKDRVQIKAAPAPNLRQISNAPGNPANAVYIFTAPSPGRYVFNFEARLGNKVETKDVEIEVRPPEAPEPPPNNEPSIVLTRTGTLSIRAEAFDPDRNDRVCIRPVNPGDLVNPREACGVGRVSVDYMVSDARVRNDPPQLIGFSQLIEPSCKQIRLTFLVTDARGGQSTGEIELGINGVWRAVYDGFGTPSGFKLDRVIPCD